LYQVDFSLLKNIINSISWPIFILAIFILLSEGYFTALRFKLFTPGNPSIKSCLEITSWFIVSLIILPARLGEIAVIVLLKNILNQSTGSSIMNVLSQRLIDVLFLCAMLLMFLLAINIFEQYIYIFIFIIIILLLLSLYKLDVLLGFIAYLFRSKKYYAKNNFLRNMFRMILQARIWHRFHLNNKIVSKAILISTCKWSCNIGGLSLLFYSLNVPLNDIQLLLVSTAYNILGAVPLQTIGGFGTSEAGLAGILMFFSLPIAFAASISITVRLVLITATFIFFLLVYSYILVLSYEKNG